METRAKIRRLYHVEGQKIKAIARKLKISKNTVRSVLRSDEVQPRYSRARQPHPVLEQYIASLETRLTYDQTEPKRRRRTATKLYQEIQQEGYSGCYKTVNDFVNQWKCTHQGLQQNTFTPLDFELGESFQFDWSEEEIELDGELTRIKVAQVRLCHSRLSIAIAFPNEQLEMVLSAHDQAFQFFGGSPKKGIYDNMKTAVTTILTGKKRIFNRRFLEMASHHLFEPIACTPRSGWEKGQVEHLVQTHRRNLFTPLCKVKTLDELNHQLREQCLQRAKVMKHPEQKDKTVWEIYQIEKMHLIPYQGEFNACKILATVVSSTCLIRYDTNGYSVDCAYARKSVEIHAYADKIKIYYKNILIGEHVRSFKRYRTIYNPWHYVPLLERKPGTLRNGAPFKNWCLPKPIVTIRMMLAQYDDGDKQFIKILLQIKKFSLEALSKACEKSVAQGISNADIILNYLTLENNEVQHDDVKNPSMCLLTIPLDSDCSLYNLLLKNVTHTQQEIIHAA